MEMKGRLFQARKDAGMTQSQLAKLVGLSRGGVAQWEAGTVIPRRTTLTKVAEATGKSLLWIEHGIDNNQTGLIVVGEVSAGVWREGTMDLDPYCVPVAPHPDFPSSAQRLYKVRGTSVNKTVEDGGYVHCVQILDGGITPENGDLVVVQKHEHGLTEYTAKRLIKDGTKWILRPDSVDPKWQEDIILNGDESTSIEITDVVIAKWTPLWRSR